MGISFVIQLTVPVLTETQQTPNSRFQSIMNDNLVIMLSWEQTPQLLFKMINELLPPLVYIMF